MYICQAESAALKFIDQPLMIDAHQVHKRCLEIMNMNRIFHNVVTKIIRLPITETRLHASARHPHGKASGMMIASVICSRKFALDRKSTRLNSSHSAKSRMPSSA